MNPTHSGHDHGHTVAGWTGTGTALAGSVVSGGSMVTAWYPGVALGAGLIVLAACVTWVLHLAGWGKAGGPRPFSERDWRVRDAAAAEGHPGCAGCRLAGRGRRAAPAATVAAEATTHVDAEGHRTPARGRAGEIAPEASAAI
ncbi:HGxxPAAW family protein [Streptomyces sp. NPDC016675]|uniref:HGxxPAAW family protein n=1 Tax=Streptomyces sp. NPDC016675 TaxID=3364970 RepID=UPI0036FDB150